MEHADLPAERVRKGDTETIFHVLPAQVFPQSVLVWSLLLPFLLRIWAAQSHQLLRKAGVVPSQPPSKVTHLEQLAFPCCSAFLEHQTCPVSRMVTRALSVSK